MNRIALLRLSLMLVLAACSDDDGGASTLDGGDEDAGGGACPNLAGTWTISEHCGGAPLIGMTVPVTQSGCVITTGGTFAGFTGTVGNDGAFTLDGVANGTSVSCTGTATTTTITEDCTGDCHVVMTK